MNKFHWKLVAGLATVAFCGLLGSAHAQPLGAPPALGSTETAAPPPMMSAPPAAAPATSDMSGQIGLGVGVVAGTDLIKTNDAVVMMKYWLTDTLSIMPEFQVKIYKTQGIDMNWAINPKGIFLFCPFKTTSTRLSIGGGIGLEFAKWGATPTPAGAPPDLSVQRPQAPGPDTYIGISVPIYIGLEHFFTKWFSMGIALENNFLEFGKQGTPWVFAFGLDNVHSLQAVGSLLFYTD
jgi:hypothetical protein